MFSLKELTAKTISLNPNQECIDEIKEQIRNDTVQYIVYTTNMYGRYDIYKLDTFSSLEEAETYGEFMKELDNDIEYTVIKSEVSSYQIQLIHANPIRVFMASVLKIKLMCNWFISFIKYSIFSF